MPFATELWKDAKFKEKRDAVYQSGVVLLTFKERLEGLSIPI